MNDYINRREALNAIFDDKPGTTIVDRLNRLSGRELAPVTITEDGTLMVTVGENENINRVIVLYGDSVLCGVFYPDGEREEK